MKTLFIFLFVLLAFYSCDTDEPISAEDLSAATVTNMDDVDVASRPGNYLIWLNGTSAETKKVAVRLHRETLRTLIEVIGQTGDAVCRDIHLIHLP